MGVDATGRVPSCLTSSGGATSCAAGVAWSMDTVCFLHANLFVANLCIRLAACVMLGVQLTKLDRHLVDRSNGTESWQHLPAFYSG